MGLFDWFKKKDNSKEINENNNIKNTEETLVQEDLNKIESDTGVEVKTDTEKSIENSVAEKNIITEETTVEDNAENTNPLNNTEENIEEEFISIDENIIEETEDKIVPVTEDLEENVIEGQEDTTSSAEKSIEEDNNKLENIVENIIPDNEIDVQENQTEEISQNEEHFQKEDKPKGFFAKIKAGLSKTRNNILSSVENVLSSFTKIDEELYEELEEALIMADIGVDTSLYVIEKLREKVKDDKIHDPAEVKGAIVKVITEILEKDDEPMELPHPSVLLVIGVNGVGKTTTIGKLTHNYMEKGKTVLLAAADTFRAAAIDQLQIWADRNNAQLIKHQENSDPGAVVYDAVQAAKARNTDILICDTAGRLHNKKNLMEELRKIAKIVNKEYPDAKVETLLVLDATTGQNALQQAKLFKEVADITGLVLTKLDGTAKGGIVLAIKHEMNIPVRYIGVGEQIDDLQEFNSKDFAKALFDEE